MKICIACGMPMKEQSDYAMNDTDKDYCVYCAREDGSMQSYEEKLKGMTHFIVKTQGLDQVAAANAAQSMLKKLPAWKELFAEGC